MNDMNLGLLILRVVVGGTLVLHGQNKFRGLEGTAGWFSSIGMKPGKIHAIAAASTETFGGLALALGFLTPLAAMAIVGTMSVAGWVDHRKAFFIFKGGCEFVVLIAAACVAIATVGPGEWSLDNVIGFNVKGVAGLLLAGAGGLAAAGAHLALFFRPPAAETA